MNEVLNTFCRLKWREMFKEIFIRTVHDGNLDCRCGYTG